MSYEPFQSEFDDDRRKPLANQNHAETPGFSGPTKSSENSGKEPATADDAIVRCSYCSADFVKSSSNHMPFCSKRCQHIDLGMWLNESYGFPNEGESAPVNHGEPEDDGE